MKKLIILLAIAMSGLVYNNANAQVRIHVGFGFSTPPVVYAPAPVVEEAPIYQQPAYYQNNNDYYYLPDVGAYYSVNERCYYYNDGDNWVSAAYLPGEYHDYDWRSVRRYEVRAPRPYLHDDIYRSRYNGHEIQEWAHNNNYNEHFDRNYEDRGYRNEHRYNTWRQGGYYQPEMNRDRNDYGRRFDNWGQGDYQHGDHRDGGRFNQREDFRDARGNSEHFSQNNSRNGYESHRMAGF